MGMKAMATLAGRLLCRAVNQSPCAHAAPNSRFLSFGKASAMRPLSAIRREFMNYLLLYVSTSFRDSSILRCNPADIPKIPACGFTAFSRAPGF